MKTDPSQKLDVGHVHSQKRFSDISRNFFGNKTYFIPSVFAIVNAVLTYLALTTDDVSSFFRDGYGYHLLFALNIFSILILTSLVVGNIYYLRKKTKTHPEGSRFRYRLVSLFTLAALLPALMVAVFSAITFKKAADGWFAVGVENAIYNAQAVSEAYLSEHNNNIKADAFAVMSDMTLVMRKENATNNDIFKQMRVQMLLRDLLRIVIYSNYGQVAAFIQDPREQKKIGKHNLSITDIMKFQKDFPHVRLGGDHTFVSAFLPMKARDKKYILRIDRRINAAAVQFQEKTASAVSTYDELKRKKHTAELGFALIYISFGLAAVAFMVHSGMYFATQMTRPLEDLTQTVRLVEKGDPYARMPQPERQSDEIDRLIVAFNRMADTLDERKHDLVQANIRLNARRRLNESVLASVSSGVIGIGENGIIRLLNERAEDILGIENKVQYLSDISCDLYTEIQNASLDDMPIYEFDHNYTTPSGEARHLHIRLCPCDVHMASQDHQIDIVITVDDVTELVKAQSMSAWQDVARRIAHEIKNPLTPISLSVERIKRKWGREIQKDKALFDECVATILRQVDHIRETAESFSGFAKTPAPQKEHMDIIDTIREVIFLEQMRMYHIHYTLNTDISEVMIYGDSRLLSQALINILKNAAESITQSSVSKGHIAINVTVNKMNVHLSIKDNGAGLPEDIPSYKFFEPYVTEREEGTGLGLAITAKIIADHGGRVALHARDDEQGAELSIILPLLDARDALESDKLEKEEIMS